MSGVGSNNGLIGGQQCIQNNEVCLGAAYQEVYICFRSSTERADQLSSFAAEGIQTITAGLDQVGFMQGFQNLGVGSFAVIISETVHRYLSLSERIFFSLYHAGRVLATRLLNKTDPSNKGSKKIFDTFFQKVTKND